MSDLRELYQEVILDHGRHPRNQRELPQANRCAEGHNPLCGDKVDVFLLVEDGVIADVAFEGTGCAISMASASVMTEMLKGKSEAEAEAVFRDFHGMTTGEVDADTVARLGKLAVFSGVKDYPARVKCATLPWHTLQSALRHDCEKDSKPDPIEAAVIAALKTVFDPEIPVSIYDLGLIYDVDVSPEGLVLVEMTLTSPGCPVAEWLPEEVVRKVSAVDGVSACVADVVWEPEWTPEMMSEAAKLELNMFN